MSILPSYDDVALQHFWAGRIDRAHVIFEDVPTPWNTDLNMATRASEGLPRVPFGNVLAFAKPKGVPVETILWMFQNSWLTCALMPLEYGRNLKTALCESRDWA